MSVNYATAEDPLSRLKSRSIYDIKKHTFIVSISNHIQLYLLTLPRRIFGREILFRRVTAPKMTSFKPARLAYIAHEPVTGTDEKLSPIIFLHGATDCKETWKDIPQNVADSTKRKAYSVDARNHGDSETSDDYDFDMNVDDLLHFMDAQGIQRAVLVGHSMGGVTAIKTALQRPDRVEKIVVEDMLVRKCPQEITDAIQGFMGILRKALEEAPADLDEDETKKFVLEYLLSHMPPELKKMWDNQKKVDPAASADFLNLRRGADGRFTTKAHMKALEKALKHFATEYSEPEGKFDGQACFIYGTLSAFKVGDDEEHIKQFFPKAVLVGFETDHDVHHPKAAEFTDALVKFVS